jgi:hypothetical protein
VREKRKRKRKRKRDFSVRKPTAWRSEAGRKSVRLLRSK